MMYQTFGERKLLHFSEKRLAISLSDKCEQNPSANHTRMRLEPTLCGTKTNRFQMILLCDIVIVLVCVKDTNPCELTLEGLVKPPYKLLLVMIDICALYTDVPHREGRGPGEKTDKRTEDMDSLFKLVFTKIWCQFNDHYYEQISSTAMGTKCAPMYAILFMHKFEKP